MIEAALVTLLESTLADTAGTRIFPLVSPEPAVAPLCVYQSLGSEVEHYIGGETDLLHTRMQIDVYANTMATAKTMAKAVRKAIKAWNVPLYKFIEDAGTDLIEDTVEPKLYRVSMRFILTHQDA